MNLTRGSLEGTIETLKEDLEKDWALRDSAWAAGLARGLASWLRAFADLYDPPIRQGDPIYSDGGVLKRKLPDGTMVAVNVAPAPRTMNRAQFAAEIERATAEATRGLVGVQLCACQPNPATFGDSRIDCMGPSASFICECACHPENRRYTGPLEVAVGFKAPAPFPPGPDIGPQGRNHDGRPYTDDPGHPLVWPTPLKDCDCQPVGGVVYKNLSCHCTKASNAGEPCPCRCHPENR